MRLISSLALVAVVAPAAFAQGKFGNEKAITPDRLKAHLYFVAHDLLEGRNTPSRGLDIACWYVATQLQLWGAQPAGDDGTFFQKVKLVKGRPPRDPNASIDPADVSYTQNVVAVIPGSDPKLKEEYVAFGAHIDHVGMRANVEGDNIWNGADDDGSGTVSILEIAHAFLTGPRPKRSLLFVWHTGEEKGLWGSRHFVNNPTVDLSKVVTQLNIDMIGRSKKEGDTNPANNVLTGPNEIYVVGSTKMSTDLQKTSESVNKDFLNLGFNYKYDDPKDTERIFFRSDHYNYAVKGIPIIFYFDGVHEDYHGKDDEADRIDYDKMSRVARTIYATGWTLANAKARPVVDKPLASGGG